LIKAALGAYPKKAGAVLKQAVDAQISQAIHIILEGVLLPDAYSSSPRKRERIDGRPPQG
jgi:hypothetical protein